MTEIKNPSTDGNTLSRACAASLRANGNLMACMLINLPKEKQEAIDRLLAGGGRVGIETLIDAKASNTVQLVAIEREGTRLVLATVATPQAAGVH